jgi:FlaG/FlaF family flagellin (archaellin)
MIAVCSGITHGATIRRLDSSTLLESPATITVDVGSRVTVACSEQGGTVRWYGPDGEAVVEGDRVKVKGPDYLQTLTFTRYQSSQGGWYECRSSKDGIKETQIVRFVSPEPTTESTGSTEKATSRESITPTTTPLPKMRGT